MQLSIWVAAFQKEVAVSEVCEGDSSSTGWFNPSFCPRRWGGGMLAYGSELCHTHLAALHLGRHGLENNILWVLSVLVGNSYFSAGKREGKGYLKRVQPVAVFMMWWESLDALRCLTNLSATHGPFLTAATRWATVRSAGVKSEILWPQFS